jgi:hypothetical protein
MKLKHLFVACFLMSFAARVSAWDYEGHRTVNQLALSTLPANFPAFVSTPEARERIAFLGGELDRWRNVKDLATSHYSGPDHYFDIEELAHYGIAPADLTPFRYDFIARLALARAAAPEKFPAPEAARNEDHTRELPGLLPWALAEYYGKLKSAFAYLRAFQTYGGTPDEIKNAEGNIIALMGTMGHLAADAAQPLHTTVHHHGWVGANPHGYATNTSFHQWIDGGFLAKSGGLDLAKLRAQVRPAKLLPDGGKGVEPFGVIVPFVVAQNQQVEPLYRLEKAGQLQAGTDSAAGRAFLEGQLVLGAQLLGDLWLSAWQQAPEDKYLKGKLTERKAAAEANAGK